MRAFKRRTKPGFIKFKEKFSYNPAFSYRLSRPLIDLTQVRFQEFNFNPHVPYTPTFWDYGFYSMPNTTQPEEERR